MRREKRRSALLLAALLLTAILATAAGAAASRSAYAGGTGLPAVPAVKVEGNRVTAEDGETAEDGGTAWFELSLRVSAARFQSVGVVLAYDTAVLCPVDWTTGAAVSVTGVDWSEATALPTKGSDALAGKPALACFPAYEPDSPAYAYLYLGADALAFTDLDGERVVTVRFAYADGKSAADVTMPTAGAEAPASGHYTVELAPADIAAGAIPGCPLLTTAEDSAEVAGSIAVYQYGGKYTGYDSGYAPTFALIDNGESAGAGSGTGGGSGTVADPDDFFPITFYDWDGITLLGTKVVGKVSDDAEQEKLIQEAMEQMRAEKSATAEQLNGALWYDDGANGADLPLTYKRGYTFGKWIDFDAVDADGSEVYTSYGKAVEVTNATATIDIPEPAGHAYTEADRNGFTVKAAYYTNADMEPLNAVDGTNYTIRNYTIEVVSYLQFSGTDNYSFDVRVRRLNTVDGSTVGVHRVRELGLRVIMMVGGTQLFMLQTLDNQDDVTATIAVNSAVTEVGVEVVDLCDVLGYGGTSNWATGASSRSNRLSQLPGSGHTDPGFKFYSALAYINQQCALATAMGDTPEDVVAETLRSGASVTTRNFTDADLNTSSPVYGTTGGPGVRRLQAFANMLAMYQSLPAPRDLTWDELQEAIKRGTVWSGGAESGGWTNGFTGTYVP